MQVAELKGILKNNVLQNIAVDFYGDAEWIFAIKSGLQYIFGAINRKSLWYYTAVEETLTPEPGTDNKIFKTTNKIQGFIMDKKSGNTGVYVKSSNAQYHRKNFFVDDLQGYYYTVSGDSEGINTITLSQGTEELTVRYKRGPVIPTIDNQIALVDIPNDLEAALKMYCLWQVVPVELENGAQLSQYYMSQMTNELQNYMDTIGENIPQDGFITE